MQGLSEGLYFATRSVLDAYRAVEALSKGSVNSWFMENPAAGMAEGCFDSGGATHLMHKDLSIVLAECAGNRFRLPMMKIIAEFHEDIIDMGYGDWDSAALLERPNRLEGDQDHTGSQQQFACDFLSVAVGLA